MLGREHALGHPALTDPATGLANQLHFDLVYSYLFGAADRGVALTVMRFFVEGVDEGDPEGELLGALGEVFQNMTRSSDLVAHMGGGHFVVLLLGANLQGGLLAADRVESAVKEVASGTTACGLAAYVPEMKEPTDLLQAADTALRKAQEAGGGVEIVKDA